MTQRMRARGIVAVALPVFLLTGTARAGVEIRTTPEASGPQQLAANEVFRYLYLRMGTLPDNITPDGTIVIVQKDGALLTEAAVRAAAKDLRFIRLKRARRAFSGSGSGFFKA